MYPTRSISAQGILHRWIIDETDILGDKAHFRVSVRYIEHNVHVSLENQLYNLQYINLTTIRR